MGVNVTVLYAYKEFFFYIIVVKKKSCDLQNL